MCAPSCIQTLCHPMICSSPGSSVREILQSRIWSWCHFLQEIFMIRWNSYSLCLLLWEAGSLPAEPSVKPLISLYPPSFIFLLNITSVHNSGTTATSGSVVILLQQQKLCCQFWEHLRKSKACSCFLVFMITISHSFRLVLRLANSFHFLKIFSFLLYSKSVFVGFWVDVSFST